jgi:hypothetical protein
MKKRDVIVVGSGVSGVHATLPVVEAEHTVTMLDVGYSDETYASLIPEKPFAEIRRWDWGQHRYFLGDQFEGIDLGPVGPTSQITPPRQYILRDPATLAPIFSPQFAALASLARGGLGGSWGAVSFPFTNNELTRCGFIPEEIRPHYEAVARHIGVSGCQNDDLVAVRGPLKALQPPLDLDGNAQAILERYRKHQMSLHQAGALLGQSLMAALTQPLGSRQPNPYHDMDYWSNPGGSIYRPELDIRELLARPNFRYERALVERFEEVSPDHVRVRARLLQSNESVSFEARALILAAGALGTVRIVLRSFRQFEISVPLTCNRHVYVPCLLPRQLGRRSNRRRHSLAQLTMIYDPTGDGKHLVQAQFHPYGSLLFYRLLKESPLAYRESLRLLKTLAPGFAIWLIEHEDAQSPTKFVTLRRGDYDRDVLEVNFRVDEDEKRRQRLYETRMLKLMRRLGSWPIKRVEPIDGSSIHYGSTLPFSDQSRPLTTQKSGRLSATHSVYVADGSSFRYLPSKGLTLTLMANARRVGCNVLRCLKAN